MPNDSLGQHARNMDALDFIRHLAKTSVSSWQIRELTQYFLRPQSSVIFERADRMWPASSDDARFICHLIATCPYDGPRAVETQKNACIHWADQIDRRRPA